MISEVRLVDFKNHVDSEYELLSGINAIVGPGGCGKTSIMEAIGWSMFGTLPGKKADFERIGSTDDGFVELILDAGEYAIHKSFSGYSALDRGSRLTADKEMDVREALSDILGNKRLDVLFSGLIGVTQGSIDDFFSRSTSERVKHFSKIIGVDEYKKCADWLIEAHHLLDKEIDTLQRCLVDAEKDVKVLADSQSKLRVRELALIKLEQEAIPVAEKEVADTEGEYDIASEIREIDSKLDKPGIKRAMDSIAGHFCPECGGMLSGEKFKEIEAKYSKKFDEAAVLWERRSSLIESQEISEYVFHGHDVKPLDTYLAERTRNLNRLLAEKNVLKGEISVLEKLMSSDLDREMEIYKSNLASAKIAMAKITEIRAVCRKVPTVVAEEITFAVSDLATYFAKMIYEDWTVTWTNEFSIVVDDGTEKPFHLLSKSEKGIAALSVTLALAKEVSPIDFILLDEPFANMDANQVTLVANAIKATGWFSQVILTTHRAEVEHVFDNVIEVAA